MKVRVLLPKRMYDARLRAGLTQEDVAYNLRQRGIGASAKQISRWESGVHAPRAGVIPAIADVLGCSIDELYGNGDDDEEDDPSGVMTRAVNALAAHGEFDLAAALQREAARAGAQERAVRS